MNKDLLKTIEELKERIDKEIEEKDLRLKEIEEMEKIEEMTNKKLDNLLGNISEDDIKVFEYYKHLINDTDTTFAEIIQPLTDKGIINLIKTISNVYVKHIYDGDFKATRKEIEQLAHMFIFTKIYNRNNNNEEIFLEGTLFSTVASAKEVNE